MKLQELLNKHKNYQWHRWLMEGYNNMIYYISYSNYYYKYHKINLVLLNSDAERIEYIEKFTL